MINVPDPGQQNPRQTDRPAETAPVAEWQSKFSAELSPATVVVASSIELQIPVPARWNKLDVPAHSNGPQHIWTPEGLGAILIIGAGSLSQGDTIESVASSGLRALLDHGAEVPVVMSIPVIREEEPRSGHMLNFPTKLPHRLLGGRSMDPVDYFKYVTVVEIDGTWLSVETAAWGTGCNAAVEVEAMGKLHQLFSARSTG